MNGLDQEIAEPSEQVSEQRLAPGPRVRKLLEHDGEPLVQQQQCDQQRDQPHRREHEAHESELTGHLLAQRAGQPFGTPLDRRRDPSRGPAINAMQDPQQADEHQRREERDAHCPQHGVVIARLPDFIERDLQVARCGPGQLVACLPGFRIDVGVEQAEQQLAVDHHRDRAARDLLRGDLERPALGDHLLDSPLDRAHAVGDGHSVGLRAERDDLSIGDDEVDRRPSFDDDRSHLDGGFGSAGPRRPGQRQHQRHGQGCPPEACHATLAHAVT